MIMYLRLVWKLSFKHSLELTHNAVAVPEVRVRFLKYILLQHIFQFLNPSSFSIYPPPKSVCPFITKFTDVMFNRPPHQSFSCLTTEVINPHFPLASLTLGGPPSSAIIMLFRTLMIRISNYAQVCAAKSHNKSLTSFNFVIGGPCFKIMTSMFHLPEGQCMPCPFNVNNTWSTFPDQAHLYWKVV